MSANHWVDIGKVAGVIGLKGWVKVHSYAAPRERILDYGAWFLCSRNNYLRYDVVEGARHGKGIIAKLETVDDRENAANLMGARIVVSRDQFEPLARGEFYWFDLVGLTVMTVANELLGKVDYLIETGANDVLVIKGERERLIPFVQGRFIKKVDPEDGKIIVDWDPDF